MTGAGLVSGARVGLGVGEGWWLDVYNGIENSLNRLAHGVDESVPSGNESRRLLIAQMSEPIPSLRPALLSRELAARIDEYRRFRHAFRHMYFFGLQWARLRPLVNAAPALLEDFVETFDGAACFSRSGALRTGTSTAGAGPR